MQRCLGNEEQPSPPRQMKLRNTRIGMTLMHGCPCAQTCVGPVGRGAAFMMTCIQYHLCTVGSSGRATAPSYWGGTTEMRSLVPGGEFPSRYAFKAESEAEGKCGEGGERKSDRSGR